MNEDVFAGQWKQLRGTLKSWWGRLSDDDFEWAGGQKDKLIGLVQEKYGYTLDEARNEVNRRFDEYGDKSAAGIGNVKANLDRLGETAAGKARAAATAVTDQFETAASYLQENKLEAIAADVKSLIRKHPIPSFFVGIGLLYCLLRTRHD